jgi:phosphotransferase system enzyme I (PtsI)
VYLGAASEPTEEDHYQAYARVIQEMAGHPVVIRTLDLGADKLPNMPQSDDERNPFLGLRSIRLSLSNVDLFRTQLRAILRASALGDVRVMFPMISTAMELRQAKSALADAMEDLEEMHVPFRRDVPVGMMVEVPSAVLMLDRFVEEVDFISLGTNDLIQYALAVDRSNHDVAHLYTAADPAVIRLIDSAIQTAHGHNVPVSLCGQMSGNPRYTMLLLGLGLRSLSVAPAAVPEIKRICRSVTIPQCEKIAQRVRSLDNARDVKAYLTDECTRVFPDLPI